MLRPSRLMLSIADDRIEIGGCVHPCYAGSFAG